jgi:hypothetical protein
MMIHRPLSVLQGEASVPKRMSELEAELSALRAVLEDLADHGNGAELGYRRPDGEFAELSPDLHERLQAVLGPGFGRDLVRRVNQLEEVARASRRVLFHMRREHARLAAGCEYCAFELGQLDRTLTRLHGERG